VGTYARGDIVSYMGRVNYSFDDRYLLTLTYRADGSSRLAPGNKWHDFPSAALAWNISKEAFLEKVNVINNLKLRISYGSVGQQSINSYQTLGQLSPLVYNFGTQLTTGVYPSAAPNPELTWEYTKTANIGVDFGFLRNRVSGSNDVYHQYTNSLLLPQTLPPTTGIPSQIVTNIGKNRKSRYEVHLNTINIQASQGII
jgi:hypothetical protein